MGVGNLVFIHSLLDQVDVGLHVFLVIEEEVKERVLKRGVEHRLERIVIQVEDVLFLIDDLQVAIVEHLRFFEQQYGAEEELVFVLWTHQSLEKLLDLLHCENQKEDLLLFVVVPVLNELLGDLLLHLVIVNMLFFDFLGGKRILVSVVQKLILVQKLNLVGFLANDFVLLELVVDFQVFLQNHPEGIQFLRPVLLVHVEAVSVPLEDGMIKEVRKANAFLGVWLKQLENEVF